MMMMVDCEVSIYIKSQKKLFSSELSVVGAKRGLRSLPMRTVPSRDPPRPSRPGPIDDDDDNECHRALPPASQKSKTGKDFTETFWIKIPRCQFYQMFFTPLTKVKGKYSGGKIMEQSSILGVVLKLAKAKKLNKSVD